MKIKTELLQGIVVKAIQGASFNKMIPLTSLIGILVEPSYMTLDESILTLITTDGSNQLRIGQKIEKTDQFYTIVNADIFSKLVGKTTKEFIELENKENYLSFTGNGEYKLDIAIDEEGQIVRFPEITNSSPESEEIDTKGLKDALNISKSSVAKTMEVPYLTGYYIGTDNIISTDRQLACSLKKQLVKEPLLISNEIAQLLNLIDEEKVKLYRSNNNLVFTTDTIVISGKELENKDLYPVQAIDNLTKLEYSNNITVNRQELLSILDRMSLFVNDYDKNGIFLMIGINGLAIQSQKSNAVEYIDIETAEDVKLFTCLVDIEMLKSQLESLQEEKVTIYYGQDKSIELKEKDTTLVISLLEKAN